MRPDDSQFDFELSAEMATEINLLRRQLGNSSSLAEAINRLILRGLAGTWEQTHEVCTIAYERAKAAGEEPDRIKACRARIVACDDALQRLARLSQRRAVLHKQDHVA